VEGLMDRLEEGKRIKVKGQRLKSSDEKGSRLKAKAQKNALLLEPFTLNLKVRSFATLRDALGGDEIELAIEPGQSIHDALLRLEQVYGEPVKAQLRDAASGQFVPFLVMLNNRTVPISRRGEVYVQDGDCLTILLPIDGG
jgi:molybdopterin synthase sulfur carrier subunit